AELETAQRLLGKQDVRLLALTGIGGVGKTRLALKLAELAGGGFRDGCCVVNLAPLQDPALVQGAIARALGVAGAAGEPIEAVLHRALADRQLLLVLDNFEQVLPAAVQLAGLLSAAPGVKLLVTSRVRLRLAAEHLLILHPLPVPADEAEEPAGPDQLLESPAVQLFVARLQAIEPGFELSEANGGLVAAICRHLEGIPLALELAAARARLLTLEALWGRLQPRLPLLTGGPIDLPARHQSLRLTISWSYDLLEPALQALFCQLSLFDGGCRLEALAALDDPGADPGRFWQSADPAAAPQPAPADLAEAAARLEALLDNHLVSRQADDDGEPRFVMLETIREFALEQLEAHSGAVAMRQNIVSYYLGLAEAAAPALHGPAQAAWLDYLEREHANLRAALRLTLARHDARGALRLAAALGWFWSIRGHLTDGRRWLDEALAIGAAPTPERLHALNAAARLACDQSDYPAAQALLDESQALAENLGDGRGLADALQQRGILARSLGDLALADDSLADSQRRYEQLGERQGRAQALNNRGIAAKAGQRPEEAAALYEQSLAAYRELGNLRGMAIVLNNLGVMAKNAASYGRARELYGEALELFRRLRDRRGSALALSNLGVVALHEGRAELAGPAYGEALELFRQLGDAVGVASVTCNLADLALGAGEAGEADRLYRDGLRRCWDLGVKPGVVACAEGLAASAQRGGDPAAAAWLRTAAARLAAELGVPTEQQLAGSPPARSVLASAFAGQDAAAIVALLLESGG
ncbi:MAG TPA: tetratricopeptide repeat protein, partial [Herpetosiphonaceae bacterium]